jgi:small subunit ribosomal protein S2
MPAKKADAVKKVVKKKTLVKKETAVKKEVTVEKTAEKVIAPVVKPAVKTEKPAEKPAVQSAAVQSTPTDAPKLVQSSSPQSSSQKLPEFEVDLKELLEAGVHFGHQVQRWSPKMKPYIYGERNGVHIFDLQKTADAMQKAAQFLYMLGKENKKVIFVGTKRQAQDIIREEAASAGAMFMTIRWMGGLLTNWSQLQKSIAKLDRLKKETADGTYDKYTKKERLLISRDIARLERFFGGVSTLKGLPDALVVIDVTREKGCVAESMVKKIPVVGVSDSNADPTGIEHIIPANDDALRSLRLIIHYLADAYKEGRGTWQRTAQ